MAGIICFIVGFILGMMFAAYTLNEPPEDDDEQPR